MVSVHALVFKVGCHLATFWANAAWTVIDSQES